MAVATSKPGVFQGSMYGLMQKWVLFLIVLCQSIAQDTIKPPCKKLQTSEFGVTAHAAHVESYGWIIILNGNFLREQFLTYK